VTLKACKVYAMNTNNELFQNLVDCNWLWAWLFFILDPSLGSVSSVSGTILVAVVDIMKEQVKGFHVLDHCSSKKTLAFWGVTAPAMAGCIRANFDGIDTLTRPPTENKGPNDGWSHPPNVTCTLQKKSGEYLIPTYFTLETARKLHMVSYFVCMETIVV
jgi:hypothetical protein